MSGTGDVLPKRPKINILGSRKCLLAVPLKFISASFGDKYQNQKQNMYDTVVV